MMNLAEDSGFLPDLVKRREHLAVEQMQSGVWSCFVDLGQIRNILMIGVLGLVAAWAWGVDSDEIIGDQDGVVRVELSNGLEVVVVPMGQGSDGQGDGGDGRGGDDDVQVWLIVRAGSMYERDQERGAAMVIQRAIVAGTVRFSGDEIAEILHASDLGSGHQAGWFVGFDHGAYMGQVDRGDGQAFERVLALFGEVLDGASLVLDEKRVQQIIAELVEEIEDESSPQMRSRARWLPKLMKGTLFGDRLPRARVEVLRKLKARQVRGFGERLYHPGQALVLVVGDVDAQAIVQQVDQVLGAIARGQRDVMVDGRIKIDVSMRAVFDDEPRLEKHQGAMIWFRDRDDGVEDRWSDRAKRYRLSDAREAVIDRVAGEIVRYRLGRQGVEAFGGHGEVGVDQVDLFGQVDLVQIGIESSQGQWEDSIRFLVRQCDRLARDGATSEEVRRARRSLLSRWHRDADDWVGLSNRDRMGLMHWLVTTGRPMIDMVHWDRLATELMSGIRDEEIQQAVRELVDPRRACYVALVPERGSGGAPGEGIGQAQGAGDDADGVIKVVTQAMSSVLEPIDPRWMEQLADSLLDAQPDGGEVEEVSQHGASGVWSAKLDNGVQILARSVGGGRDDDRVYLTATLWGMVFGDGGFDDDEVLAGLIAWREPATESRGGRAILAYLGEHGIEVAAKQGDGYVQLRVDAPVESFGQAMELMFVLLDRPMIEHASFGRWQIECDQVGVDPLDEAIDALYGDMPRDRVGNEGVSLDRAQRVLTQIVRNARIDIAIAGAIDASTAIEKGAELFGALIDRSDGEAGAGVGLVDVQAGGPRRERVIRVENDRKQEHGIAIGYVGEAGQDLRSLRSQILAAMVLSERMKQQGQVSGFDGLFRANIWTSDVLVDRAFLLVRVWCEEEVFEQAQRVVDETIEAMVRQGIGDDELARAKGRVDALIGRYFDTPRYWSVRMSMLGFHGRRVDDLWRIRQGYREIDAPYATRVFGALIEGNDRFRIEIVGMEK